MDAAAWASWVQAVGSIVAIWGAFRIAQRQHQSDRAFDARRTHDEIQNNLDMQLQVRTLAVKNVVQVATFALESANLCIGHTKHSVVKTEAEPFLKKIEQLRAVLDSMINPGAEHLAVVSALNISRTLTLIHTDMSNTGGPNTGKLIERSENRLNEGNEALGRLIELQAKLDDLCRARRLPVDLEDFRPII